MNFADSSQSLNDQIQYRGNALQAQSILFLFAPVVTLSTFTITSMLSIVTDIGFRRRSLMAGNIIFIDSILTESITTTPPRLQGLLDPRMISF